MKQPVIGIIGGKGRMGQLFARFFRDRGVKVLVSDLQTKLSNAELASCADITIVSVPIRSTVATIKSVLPHIRKDAAIMDFTSVKEPAVKAMLKGKCEVLGIHPMFGNSNPVPGQTIILTPTRKSGAWSSWLEAFLREHKSGIVKMSAKEHDKAMALAQGLVHFADIAFTDALRRNKMPVEKLFDYTSPATELKVQLAARLINQDPDLYGNIQIENKYNLVALKNLKKSVDELIKVVRKKDLKKFTRIFNDSKKYLGDYTKEAYAESSDLIDQMLFKPQTQKVVRPSKKHTAVLGPKNTFSDIAAREFSNKYYANSIDEVYELVATGKVKEGMVPIENKLNGTVRESLDNLFRKNVHIVREINTPIHHCLVCKRDTSKAEIKIIGSHAQALSQCKKYIKKNFSKVTRQTFTSTGAALQGLTRNSAAIVPGIAADNDPELKILARNIEDNHDNSTTFILIRRGTAKPNIDDSKTSVAFHFDADSPGSLFSVFKDFADAKINMTKIESRPTKARFGDYVFYLNFEGSTAEPKIAKTLKKVAKKVAKLKVLGSY